MFDNDFGSIGSRLDDGFTISGSGRFDDAFGGAGEGGFTRSFTTGGDDVNFVMGADAGARAWSLPADSTFWANSVEMDAVNWSSEGLAGFFTDLVIGANQVLSRWTKYEP